MLTQQNIESELSYAYLHAVASSAGFACDYTTRHMDSAAVDAVVHEDGRFLSPDSLLTSFDAHFQLKATFQQLTSQEGRWSYSLPVHQYNKLREVRVGIQRFLVVLQLPQNAAEWLNHSEDCLIAKRCAYWVSLRDAPPTENTTTQTVYVPQAQLLSPAGLTGLMTRISKREVVRYEP